MDNIIEKIKKLLALSNSDNEHEAARALASAIKLSREYNIDLEKVKGTEFTDKIDMEDALIKSGISRWESKLFCGIAEEFGCQILLGYHITDDFRTKRRLVVVGGEKDRAIVIYLATYLQRCIKEMYKKNKKGIEYRAKLEGVTNYRARQDYCYGAVISVLRNARERLKTDSDNAENESSTAIIKKKGYAVQKYIERLNPKTHHSRDFNPSSAILNGFEDGKGISINKPLEKAESTSIKQLNH